MSWSTLTPERVADRGAGIPAAAQIAAAFALSTTMGAAMALASNDVRVFTLSLLCGALLGTFLPAAIPFAYVCLAVMVPVSVLVEEVSGIPYLGGARWGLTKLHPATIVILVGAFADRFAHRRAWQAVWRTRASVTRIAWAMELFIGGVLTLSVIQLHPGGILQVVENYLGPLMLFLLILAEFQCRPRRIAALTTFFIVLLTAVGVYGIVEYVLRCNLWYGPLYAVSPLASQWYETARLPEAYRITTSLGHPLTNAQYFLLAVVLAAGSLAGTTGFRRAFTGAALPVLVLATMTTGTRTTLLLLAATPFFVLVLQRRVGAAAWGVLLVGIVYLAASYSPLGGVLRQRFSSVEGTNSALVRLRSIELIPETLRMTNPLIGYKLGRSGEISNELFALNAPIGFENPWLMLMTDVGLPLTLLYGLIVAGLLLTALRAAWRTRAPAVIYAAVGAVAMVLMYSGYNSFGTKNTLNYLVWFATALALSAAPADPARPRATR
jgi:hypothetical protein